MSLGKHVWSFCVCVVVFMMVEIQSCDTRCKFSPCTSHHRCSRDIHAHGDVSAIMGEMRKAGHVTPIYHIDSWRETPYFLSNLLLICLDVSKACLALHDQLDKAVSNKGKPSCWVILIHPKQVY